MKGFHCSLLFSPSSRIFTARRNFVVQSSRIAYLNFVSSIASKSTDSYCKCVPDMATGDNVQREHAVLQSFNCISYYDWKIDNFSKRDQTPITQEFVVPFPYKEFIWKLTLHPTGFDKKFEGSLSLFLQNVEPRNELRITYSLAVVDRDHELVNKRDFNLITFLEDGVGHGCAELISNNYLIQHAARFLPNDTLTVRCIIDLSEAYKNENLERVEGEAIASFGALSDFGELFSSQKFTDFTIKVGSNSIGVHKGILASRSDVFEAMLSHVDKETIHNEVEINDIEFEVVIEMLKFIYSGNAKAVAESESLAWDLLACADRYHLKDLQTICEKELIFRLMPKNAIETVKAAVFLHADRLKNATIDYIIRKIRDIITYSNLEEDLASHPEILKMIKEGERRLGQSVPSATSSLMSEAYRLGGDLANDLAARYGRLRAQSDIRDVQRE